MLYINTPVAQPAPQPTQPFFAWSLFIEGYNAAIRGADLADMQTPEEISGWWYCNEPQGSTWTQQTGKAASNE